MKKSKTLLFVGTTLGITGIIGLFIMIFVRNYLGLEISFESEPILFMVMILTLVFMITAIILISMSGYVDKNLTFATLFDKYKGEKLIEKYQSNTYEPETTFDVLMVAQAKGTLSQQIKMHLNKDYDVETKYEPTYKELTILVKNDKVEIEQIYTKKSLAYYASFTDELYEVFDKVYQETKNELLSDENLFDVFDGENALTYPFASLNQIETFEKISDFFIKKTKEAEDILATIK